MDDDEIKPVEGEELDEEELLEDELGEDELEDDLLDGELVVEDVAAVVDGDDDDDDDSDEVPKALRKRPGTEDDDDDDDVLGEDDVEADLDTILKDRIAAGSDEEEDDEAKPDDRQEGDAAERVAAKTAEEFSCATCFMIVHPRQFGRREHLTCPEGYDPCPSIKEVEKRLKKATKK